MLVRKIQRKTEPANVILRKSQGIINRKSQRVRESEKIKNKIMILSEGRARK
jgi:hypothetical protein